MAILQEESSLNEIVQLVGKDSLSPKDQLTLETARIIREDFLQQNAFMDEDSHSPFLRQRRLLGLALHYDKLCRDAIEQGADPAQLFAIPARDRLGRAKSASAEQYAAIFDNIGMDMEDQIAAIVKGGEDE